MMKFICIETFRKCIIEVNATIVVIVDLLRYRNQSGDAWRTPTDVSMTLTPTKIGLHIL
jgi:hypothetical protein